MVSPWKCCYTLLTILAIQCEAQAIRKCPPSEAILPCRCLVRDEEYQIWCSHSNFQRVLRGLRAVGQQVTQPIDELILENNNLPSFAGRTFAPLRVIRLMLRYNGLEHVSNGWLAGLEDSLMELFIVEPELRNLPDDGLNGFGALQAVTIQSNLLKRLPKFLDLPRLRYLQVESLSLIELGKFESLPNLEKIHILGSPRLTRLETGLLQDLPKLSLVNISYCGISWVHPRALTHLPSLTELWLVGNKLTDAGMIGRATKDLPALESLHLDHNHIDKLGEAAFVDLPTLKKLFISHNRITELNHGAFHRVPMLRTLELNNNLVRRVHPESFLQHSGSGLEELWLVENDISHVAELRALLDALPRLVFLDMSRNNLQEIPFGALRGHATLERLHLDHNRLQLVEREAFMAMPALIELKLGNNSLSEVLAGGPLWNLPALKGLDLSGNYYRRLEPRLLGNLPSLRKLDLSANQLIGVDPTVFLATPHLEQVNLSYNVLPSLHPATFRHLLNLYELDVNHNGLVEFVPGLPRGIEYLHMAQNEINALPALPSPDLDLPLLRMLDVSTNDIRRIPPGTFRSFPQLRRLHFAQNSLQQLDADSFKDLSRLEILDLHGNGFSRLHPDCFSSLTELTELNLNDNRLDALRPELFRGISRLKKLAIGRNQLREISLDNARDVQIMDASHNSLAQLPESLFGMKKLVSLDLSDNRIAEIRGDAISSLASLRELRLSKNSVRVLPAGALSNLQHLKILQLDNNLLEIIEPSAIQGLPVLKSIKLDRNKLESVPSRAFEDLPALQVVELQENNLQNVAVDAFQTPQLLMLNLSHNQFVGLEDAGLKSLISLEMLDVSNNRISRLTSASLEKMEWLVELRMDSNQICAVHGSPFGGMPRLRILRMRNNKMMSFPEQAVQKLRGNLAVLDIDGNPLACTCSILWMRTWLQETSTIGPRCVDGTLLREMRLSREDCSQQETTEPIAPGCDAELLAAPGIYGTSQVFSQWMNLKENSSFQSQGENNNLAPFPEESEYFYDDYVDYPYNDSAPINDTKIRQEEIKSSHHINGDTPTIYAASARNKTKTPDAPKGVSGSPSNSGFSFFGLPLPNLSNLWGGNKKTDDQRFAEQLPAERKTAIVNGAPFDQDRRHYPPTNLHIETGGFVPLLPGSGGFKPMTSTHLLNETNTRPPLSSTEISISTPKTPTAYSTLSPTTSTLTEKEVAWNGSTKAQIQTKLEIEAPITADTKREDVKLEKGTSEPSITEVSTVHVEIETASSSDTFENIFREIEETTSTVPTTSTMISDETHSENVKKESSPSPLSALLIPGGQQPQYRPPGRPTITKVYTPHVSGSAPLQSDLEFLDVISSNGEEKTKVVQIAANKELNSDNTNWYFTNYNKSNLTPYIGPVGNTADAGKIPIICITVACFKVYLLGQLLTNF